MLSVRARERYSIHCPKCGSPRVSFFMAKKSYLEIQNPFYAMRARVNGSNDPSWGFGPASRQASASITVPLLPAKI